MFDAVRHRKAPQQIIHQVRTAILEGKLHPGDKLPSEQELTEHFGVSRQTLREAMRSLESLGLLDIRAGANGGAFVCEVDMETTRSSLANFLHFKNVSIQHISEIRKVLEPYAAGVAARNMSDKDIKRLKSLQDACRKALTRGDTAELRKNEIRFHRAIANCTGNPVLIFILDFIENLLEDVKNILQPDETFSREVVDSHQRIWEALKKRDAELAANEMLRDVSQVETALARLAEDKPAIRWA